MIFRLIIVSERLFIKFLYWLSVLRISRFKAEVRGKLKDFWNHIVVCWKRFDEFIDHFFFRFRATEHTFMVIMAVIIGLVGGFGAVGIQFLIKVFQKIFWGNWDFSLEYVKTLPLYIKLLAPAVGGVFVGGIVYYFAREAKGHGVPEVMEAIALRNGVIRPRVVIAKLLASSICIGSGGSVGREGPVIQIGSSIGSTVGQFLRVNPKRMKILVACGAAAGIAAAFNAPVAGALFSVEVILGDFGVPQFSPIVISSVMATVVSRHFLGDFPAFEVPSYELGTPTELIFYVALGLVAGLIALLYIHTLYRFEDFFEELNIHPVLKTTIGGLIIGVLGVFIPNIYGVGYNSMNMALHGEMVIGTMLMLIFVKILATSISLGSGGSGGVFAPSLFIGTMTGGAFGILINHLFPFTSSPGAYALVGMGALVAGATHAPITAILIIFEMTNDYKLILPLMIASVIATLLTTKLKKESIYTLKLLRRGIDLFRGREINVLRSIPVREVMRGDPVIIQANMSFKKLMNLLVNSPHTQFFVVDFNNRYAGAVSLNEVRHALQDEEYVADLLIAHDLVNPNVPTLKPSDTLDAVMKIFGRLDVEELPVVEENEPHKIIGAVFYKDVIEAYNREILKRDLVEEMSFSIKLLEKHRQIPFLDGYAMAEIPVPLSFVGRTLQELNIRARFGVNVIMIKRRQDGQKEVEIVPRPDEVIQMGDVLIAVGREKDLEVMRHI